MSRLLRFCSMAIAIAVIGLAHSFATAGSAFAKDCKADAVTAEGEPFISRSLGAYPSSLLAWRKAVREQVGAEYQAWRKAEDRKVQCEQVKLDSGKKRWVCVRNARPCSGGNVATGGEEKPTFTGPLRRGSKGDEVKSLQKLLADAGYEVDVDGNFGRGTEAAVKAFQKSKGLDVDGVAGTATQEALGGVRV